MMEDDGFIAWTTDTPGGAFAISKPFDGNPATAGNDVMIAIAAGSRETFSACIRKRWSSAVPMREGRDRAATMAFTLHISVTWMAIN